MSFSRRRNKTFTATAGQITVDQATLQVVQDIRDELQAIRVLVECQNVSRGFVAMQSLERHIKRRFPNKPKGKK
jgi:hypothetical protein